MSGPTSLFRHRLILSALSQLRPSSILEVGFGNGDLLLKLNARGYRGKGIDFSPPAVNHFQARTQHLPFNFNVQVGTAEDLQLRGERFPAVIACEVLEHIEDDIAALRSWRKLLPGQGHLVLSVPAHMKHWGHNDEYAGHLRRYEREELVRKLDEAGFSVKTIYCYGYPFSLWAKAIGDRLIRKNIKPDADQIERTKESGIHNVSFRGGSVLLNELTMFPLYLIQKLFVHTDRGIGYIVIAQRRE